MLYLNQTRERGLVGKVGTIIGQIGFNVVAFQIGHGEAGGETQVLIQLDGPFPAACLSEIRTLPLIRDARSLNFSATA